MDQIKAVGLGESSTSYNVKILFTSVPMDSAISIIRQKLAGHATTP